MILEIKNLVKTFPGVKALHRVDFQLEAGEIHALVGGHGAGKSAFIKVLAGVYNKDSGIIRLNGETFEPESLREAEHKGINAVFHEVNLIPNLTLAENIFMERQPKKMGIINWKETNRLAVEALREFDLNIDVSKELGMYSVAVQQMVVIARALQMQPRVLVLDEPTSSLNNEEAKLLFNRLKKLKSEGCSIIFVTHYLDQVYDLCDRVTLLEKGENAGTWRVDEIAQEELQARIDSLETPVSPDILTESPVSDAGGEAEYLLTLEDIGEVGLAEILESGRSEIAEVEFECVKTGTDSAKRISEESLIIREPVFALKSAKENGSFTDNSSEIIGGITVAEYIIQALQVKRGWFSLLHGEEQMEYVRAILPLFSLLAEDMSRKTGSLDNVAKERVLLAKSLAADPASLLVVKAGEGVDLMQKNPAQKYAVILSTESVSLVILPDKAIAAAESGDWNKVLCRL